ESQSCSISLEIGHRNQFPHRKKPKLTRLIVDEASSTFYRVAWFRLETTRGYVDDILDYNGLGAVLQAIVICCAITSPRDFFHDRDFIRGSLRLISKSRSSKEPLPWSPKIHEHKLNHVMFCCCCYCH